MKEIDRIVFSVIFGVFGAITILTFWPKKSLEFKAKEPSFSISTNDVRPLWSIKIKERHGVNDKNLIDPADITISSSTLPHVLQSNNEWIITFDTLKEK